jgi:hypothetical protein
MRALVVVTVVLVALHAYAAYHVGFGDSEALYAAWALHPQPAYLDHPGLLGIVARAIGGGSAPTPLRTHVVTTVIAAIVPWLVVFAAHRAGARKERAAAAGLAVALAPEIAIGLFALTPDLLLAILWLGALSLALVGTELALVAAGLLAGIAASTKVTGLLLIVALAIAYLRTPRRGWGFAGLAAGIVVLLPVASYEAHLGFPMLRHRLVETQVGAGFAAKNVVLLLGGQLLYVSPLLAIAAGIVAADLVRHRNDDGASRILFLSFAIPIVPLVLLSAWSPVAEPHWIAPALLALPIHGARRGLARFVRPGIAVAAVMTLAGHLWALLPSAVVPASMDITRELYGWPSAIDAIRRQMLAAATPYDPEGRELVVVGAHWTICAQIQAAMPDVRVGCASAIPDDFDRWFPRDAWRKADNVLFVSDDRFTTDGGGQLPAHVKIGESRVRYVRAGRTARIFELTLYGRRTGA